MGRGWKNRKEKYNQPCLTLISFFIPVFLAPTTVYFEPEFSSSPCRENGRNICNTQQVEQWRILLLAHGCYVQGTLPHNGDLHANCHTMAVSTRPTGLEMCHIDMICSRIQWQSQKCDLLWWGSPWWGTVYSMINPNPPLIIFSAHSIPFFSLFLAFCPADRQTPQ